ncbi:MAG: tetratricopeptide repeat protein [bacterium]|nr:tetratricopeptide repeat protein [Gammaproteobacteria bacterium]
MQFGKWLIEPNRNKVISKEKEVAVEPRVMDALVFLVTHSDRVVTTDELIERLWSGRIVEPSAVHRVINKLRSALDDSSKKPLYIETVPKRGYRVLAQVTLDSVGESKATTGHAISGDEPQSGIPVQTARLPDWLRSSIIVPSRVAMGITAMWFAWYTSQLVLESDVNTVDSSITADNPNNSLADWSPSLAVMPFQTTDRGDAGFAKLLTEEIITNLSANGLDTIRRLYPILTAAGGLRVLASDATRRYVESFESPSSIGAALGVRYLLHGDVQISDINRVALRLIKVADGEQIWSNSYSVIADHAKSAEMISMHAGSYVIEQVTDDYWYRFIRPKFNSRQSHTHFVLAHQQTMQMHTGDKVDLLNLAANYEKSLIDTPSFFFSNLFLLQTYLNIESRSISTLDVDERLSELLNNVLVQSENAQGTWVLGRRKAVKAKYMIRQKQYQAAYELTLEALQQNPNSVVAHSLLAGFYAYSGKPNRAVEEYERAIASGGSLASIFIPHALYTAAMGRPESAIALLEQNLPLVPMLYSKCRMRAAQSVVLTSMSRNDEAVDLVKEVWSSCGDAYPDLFISVLVDLGEEAEALALLRNLEKASAPNPVVLLDAYLRLDDQSRALVLLDKGQKNPAVVVQWMRNLRYYKMQDFRFAHAADKLPL